MKTPTEVREMFVALAQNLANEVATLPLCIELEQGEYKMVPVVDEADGALREEEQWVPSGVLRKVERSTSEMKEAIKNLLSELIEKVDTL